MEAETNRKTALIADKIKNVDSRKFCRDEDQFKPEGRKKIESFDDNWSDYRSALRLISDLLESLFWHSTVNRTKQVLYPNQIVYDSQSIK